MQTDRLVLRPISLDDVDALVELDSDPKVMRHLSGGRPSTRAEVEATVRQEVGHRWVAVERDTGAVIGWFGLRRQQGRDHEIGWRLRRDRWGRGLAFEGASRLLDLAFDELDAQRVYAETMAINTRSRALMARLGMRHVRTFHLEWDDPIPGTEHGEVEYEIRRPTRAVRDAWSLVDVAPLPGGQGTAFGSGDLVLKPVLDAVEAAWLAEVLASLPRDLDAIRIIRPVAAANGQWVVDGWSAWERLDGEIIGPGRVAEVLDVARRFHAVVAHVAHSESLARGHQWARGDAFAWGEATIEVPSTFTPVVAELLARRLPLDLPSQLIHGDLCNNVLVHHTLPPAVIDVSPFWRPARYADAIVIVDSIGWFGAGVDAAAPLADEEGRQLLLRAVLFRLGSAALLCADDPVRLDAELAAYERLLSALA